MPLDGERSDGDDRRKRLEALRALAEGAPAPEETTAGRGPAPVQPAQRRRWPRWALPLVGVVALLAVVAAIAVRFLPGAAPKAHTPPALLALDPETYGIACLENAAWSPDSTKVALLGTRQQCALPFPENYSYFPTLAVVVDATSGKTLSQFAPDATIQQDLHLGAPQYITPITGAPSGDVTKQAISYAGMTWTPDGKRIALTFNFFYATAPFGSDPHNAPLAYVQGLYIAGPDGSGARAVAVSQTDAGRFTGEWDMRTLTPLLASSSAQIHAASPALSPASLSYQWGTDGALTGAGPLNGATAPERPALTPVGAPGDGGASFTIWQPMSLNLFNGFTQQPVNPPAYLGQEAFLSWSPDGNYLVDGSVGPLIFQPDGAVAPNLAQLKAIFGEVAMAPVRDAALARVLQGLSKPDTGSAGFDATNTVAWSPDGRLMVNVAPVAGVTTATIYNCATGTPLKSVVLRALTNASGDISSDALWSPDGKRLLASAHSELFILGQSNVPRP